MGLRARGDLRDPSRRRLRRISRRATDRETDESREGAPARRLNGERRHPADGAARSYFFFFLAPEPGSSKCMIASLVWIAADLSLPIRLAASFWIAPALSTASPRALLRSFQPCLSSCRGVSERCESLRASSVPSAIAAVAL